ncbi:MAG: hypothetical protein ACFFFK_11305 [Candidatus Thorarchaeota archaeon]
MLIGNMISIWQNFTNAVAEGWTMKNIPRSDSIGSLLACVVLCIFAVIVIFVIVLNLGG